MARRPQERSRRAQGRVSSIALRFRAQWRQRWGTLFALTLLVGVVGATVLTTVAGARRTRSVVERTDERMKIPDAFALIESNSFAEVDAILDLPVVASGERLAIFTAFAELGYLPMVGSVDGVLGSELQYDRIIRGRRPHPNAADEVALPLGTAEEFGLDVGDSLQFHSPGPEQVRCYIDSEYGATDVCREELEIFASATPDWELLGGPSFELEVVGVTRQLDSTGAGEDLQNTFLPQGFYDAYRTTIHYIPGVAARYEAGVNDQQFEAGMGEIVGQASMPDISYSSALLDSLNSTAATLANGLLVFAGVAAVAGLVAIAQALARQAAAGAADGRVLASLGVTRAGRVVDSLVPLVPVALCGSVLAVVGAGLVSPIMPIGAAREVELARGFDFDAVVLVAGGALLAGSVIVAALVASAWMGRTRSRARVARFSAGVPASVPMGLGVRWALQPERAVPIRSAISGVALGVAGIVAVAGFSEGLERLTHDPVRTGWGWDVTISGDNVVEQDALETAGVGDRSVEDARAARILADPAVDELSLAWIGLRASVEGRAVSAYASRPYRGDIGFVVVDGRAPQGLDEVALGAKTMRRAGTGLGDEVRVGDQTMDVVGQAVFPDIGDGYTLADGALFT
ncbi:MAG: ABC transporter permease, partial [Actinomycetota bacterium]|nr:ABC transporter permease [Actinomycetota bacterium]